MFRCLNLILLLIFSSLLAQSHDLDIDALIVAGDEAHSQYDFETALKHYERAFEAEPENYDVAWRVSRAYVDVGETKSKKEERKAAFQKAHDAARTAVEADSTGAKGHLFLSVSLGRIALDAGARERVRLSKEIKAQVDKALLLDPSDDIAWHVLGMWHRRLATLSWVEKRFANLFLGGVPKEASVEKARDCFLKAIALAGEVIIHHLELGNTYEKLKQKTLARAAFEKVLLLPSIDPDDDAHKRAAEERLKKL